MGLLSTYLHSDPRCGHGLDAVLSPPPNEPGPPFAPGWAPQPLGEEGPLLLRALCPHPPVQALVPEVGPPAAVWGFAATWPSPRGPARLPSVLIVGSPHGSHTAEGATLHCRPGLWKSFAVSETPSCWFCPHSRPHGSAAPWGPGFSSCWLAFVCHPSGVTVKSTERVWAAATMSVGS